MEHRLRPGRPGRFRYRPKPSRPALAVARAIGTSVFLEPRHLVKHAVEFPLEVGEPALEVGVAAIVRSGHHATVRSNNRSRMRR